MALGTSMTVQEAHAMIASKGNITGSKDQYGLFIKPNDPGSQGTWMKSGTLSDYNLAAKVRHCLSSPSLLLSLLLSPDLITDVSFGSLSLSLDTVNMNIDRFAVGDRVQISSPTNPSDA